MVAVATRMTVRVLVIVEMEVMCDGEAESVAYCAARTTGRRAVRRVETRILR
jgi:hypothetical protein